MTLVLQAIKTHVKSTASKFMKMLGLIYSDQSIIHLEVINTIKSNVTRFLKLILLFFSTLYTSLPLHLVKLKLIGLMEKTFTREQRRLL